MLAYRARYYTGVFTYLFFVSVYYFIWKAVFENSIGADINNFSLPEMITYIAVGWVARSFYFSSTDEEVEDLVRTGQIGIYLLRPVNFQLMMIAQALGESLFRMVFFSLPISLVILAIFPILPPLNGEAFVLFWLSTALGFLVMTAINFIVGTLALFFKSVEGLIRAKYNLMQIASGLLLPLTFFPDWFRWILEALPFQAIAYIPLRFYLGKYNQQEVLTLLGTQLIWALLLIAVGALLWQSARNKLVIQGG